MKKRTWIGAMTLALMAVAACSPATPVPPPPEIDAPKQIATVVLSPTPEATVVLATLAPSPIASPTATPIPPTLTPSRTPYVGVFMGDGSAPLVLPTAPRDTPPFQVQATIQQATPLPAVVGGATLPPGVFPTATFSFVITPTGSIVQSDTGCPIDVDPVFVSAYLSDPAIPASIGCPRDIARPTQMAQQTFQRGTMVWRAALAGGETGDIYALAAGTFGGINRPFWRVADLWTDGQPESDAGLVPPEPGVIQPVRGFGLAWRSSAEIQGALGWALEGETGYAGTWQDFERGAMFRGFQGGIYALASADPQATRGQYFGPLR